MKRTIYAELLRWKTAADRKPLIVYGARQVGKTYILRAFGEREFDNLAYINCYKNPTAAALFAGDADTTRLVLGLSALSHEHITVGRTLVFLDEIQEIPPVLSSLKYFCEQMPGLHVVVAGSLLGVMNMRGESFPVGKVHIMHLYPMTFGEFLLAKGEQRLAELLAGTDDTLKDTFASTYTELLRQYYFTGGMPEAVRTFCQTQDLARVRRIQRDILVAYEADIAKHTGADTQRVRMVWQSVPAQLARENKKFIYGAVRKGARAKDFETAIQWLIDAGLLIRVRRAREAAMPLRFYADADAFKLYLLDVGLLGAMVGAPAEEILIGAKVFSEYKGAFTENYVAQQLAAIDGLPVYYYSRDNSRLEIDFLVQAGARVVAVEVKAEENVRSKSLAAFVGEGGEGAGLDAVRLSMRGFADQGWMRNVPLYAAEAYFRGLAMP